MFLLRFGPNAAEAQNCNLHPALINSLKWTQLRFYLTRRSLAWHWLKQGYSILPLSHRLKHPNQKSKDVIFMDTSKSFLPNSDYFCSESELRINWGKFLILDPDLGQWWPALGLGSDKSPECLGSCSCCEWVSLPNIVSYCLMAMWNLHSQCHFHILSLHF